MATDVAGTVSSFAVYFSLFIIFCKMLGTTDLTSSPSPVIVPARLGFEIWLFCLFLSLMCVCVCVCYCCCCCCCSVFFSLFFSFAFIISLQV